MDNLLNGCCLSNDAGEPGKKKSDAAEEQRVKYNLIVDEVSQINKQNNEYRGLIIDNEAKFSELEKEVQ